MRWRSNSSTDRPAKGQIPQRKAVPFDVIAGVGVVAFVGTDQFLGRVKTGVVVVVVVDVVAFAAAAAAAAAAPLVGFGFWL